MKNVVPYVGTWIEILPGQSGHNAFSVVPYVGTWIEIFRTYWWNNGAGVVPYVGTWIEIRDDRWNPGWFGRSLRGNVDRNE